MRSRGNSVDLEDENHAATSKSGDTYLPTPASPEHGDMHRAIGLSVGSEGIMNDDKALMPEPGTETDFNVEDNKFAFSPGQMSKLLNPKCLSAFYALGGLVCLEKGLRTNRQSGLSSDETVLDGYVSFEDAKATSADVNASKALFVQVTMAETTPPSSRKRSDGLFADRKRVFKDNHLPTKKAKNIFQFMWMTFNDQVLILLMAVSVISLGIGLYQTFGTVHTPTNPPVEWVEGVAIITAVVIIVIVGSINDYEKERQFSKLNEKKLDRNVKVIRAGKSQEISISDVLVGDVVHIEPGDVIPADGIFIDGHNVRCDESSVTGESGLLLKHPADEVFQAIEEHKDLSKMDPFIISGTKVAEGVGTFLVTATGPNSTHGKTLEALQEDLEITPLQLRLNTLAEYIAKFGGAIALLLFVVLLVEFFVRLPHSTKTPAQKCQDFLNILILALTVLVIAVPEGLPLAVTLSLAFATTRMFKDNNLVRRLKACEAMGNAMNICSDKTGTLTQNKMTVVTGTIGVSSRFVDKKWYPPTFPKSNNSTTTSEQTVSDSDADNVSTGEFVGCLTNDVKTLLKQSIVINSTAFEDDKGGQQTFIGSKTETALLAFAQDYLGIGPVSVERSNAKIVQLIPFDSARRCMVTVVNENGKYRLYVKGAPEILLGRCTRIIREPTMEISDTEITTSDTEYLNQVITNYASRSLRTIGLLYRDFEQWPPTGVRTNEDSEAVLEDILKDLVFLGIIGIQDPIREGVREAVEACQKAGVVVRMVTGDNVSTAKAIAEACGILSADGGVMEGSEFRKLSTSQMDQIIPHLQVLARSTPTDKRLLVARLKDLGEIVAVTGDGTNDALALKTADVGFSMGLVGTEVAKEASDIILMDDNFSSIVKAIMWGRAVNDAVRKFLQFQVTVSITTVVLTFVSAVASKEQLALTPVQMMWVNLIQDTMAALALATDPPAPSILDRKPDPKSAPLITITMQKMIIGQAVYQLAITLILYFGGAKILSYQSTHEKEQLQTIVFNTFVWMQIFNLYNNRRLDNRLNIFEGISRNWFFLAISLVMIGCQVIIVFVGGRAFSITRLNRAQWCYSIVLGALSIPIGVVIRLMPNKLLFANSCQDFMKRHATNQFTASDEEQQYFPQPLEEIRQQPAFLEKVHGGRLNSDLEPRERLENHPEPKSNDPVITEDLQEMLGEHKKEKTDYGAD
ncbi:calcium-translocating P-type ATPase [Wilcoxina mikolae CBS 423.85]|nr:calcium-translocating P-type ATPase [Wilcoxina mikolae CBS 423.85]